jgi:hypothetical protein
MGLPVESINKFIKKTEKKEGGDSTNTNGLVVHRLNHNS